MRPLEIIEERLRKVHIVAPTEMHVGVAQLQQDCAWLVGEVRRLEDVLVKAAMDWPDPPAAA